MNPAPTRGRRGSSPREGRPGNATAPPVADWPAPEPSELDRLDGPRDFGPSPGAEMTLTIEALGLVDVPVDNSDDPAALDAGVAHLPGTSLPGDGGAQRNAYLAGHRLGYPGTGSRMVFFNLDKLAYGDPITLRDRSGVVYEYEVSEIFVVDPNADWAMDPVRDRDMVTLQTCTYPIFENRIIVRADRARATSMS